MDIVRAVIYSSGKDDCMGVRLGVQPMLQQKLAGVNVLVGVEATAARVTRHVPSSGSLGIQDLPDLAKESAR